MIANPCCCAPLPPAPFCQVAHQLHAGEHVAEQAVQPVEVGQALPQEEGGEAAAAAAADSSAALAVLDSSAAADAATLLEAAKQVVQAAKQGDRAAMSRIMLMVRSPRRSRHAWRLTVAQAACAGSRRPCQPARAAKWRCACVGGQGAAAWAVQQLTAWGISWGAGLMQRALCVRQ